MKICGVVFDYENQKVFSKLAKVFGYSAAKNCPTASFELVRIKPPRHGRNWTFASNTAKIEQWQRVMHETNDDVVFIDCDTIILRDLSDAFDGTFDIGYTLRTRAPKNIPINGGVVFISNTEAAKRFVDMWRRVNDRMFGDQTFHFKWRAKYAGINQASFGYMLENGNHGAKLKTFSCREWNACGGEDWGAISDTTRVLHVKNPLRRLLIQDINIDLCDPKYRKAVRVWRTLRDESVSPGADLVLSSAKVRAEIPGAEKFVRDIAVGSLPLDDQVVADKSSIIFLSKVIRRLGKPTFGICHGSGQGHEQRWFSEALGGCEVVGTEVAGGIESVPNTVGWDFCKPNPKWENSVDFVYSNALVYAYDKREAFRTWVRTLRKGGVMLIEQYLFSFDLPVLVKEWGGGKWIVSKTFERGGRRFSIVERTRV